MDTGGWGPDSAYHRCSVEMRLGCAVVKIGGGKTSIRGILVLPVKGYGLVSRTVVVENEEK